MVICFSLILMSFGSEPRIGSDLLYRENRTLMGSPFEISVVHADATVRRQAVRAAWEEIERLESMISSWLPTSETSAINRQAGIEAVVVSPELFSLVKRSLKVSELTGGAFDITFASAGQYWDFRSRKLPDPAMVAQAVKLIDYRRVQLNESARSVLLTEPGTRIGFGGIGKGFAANRALRVLQRHGIENALVNAGGDLVAAGHDERGDPWQISLAHPRRPGKMLARLNISENAVVTSGDYERFFVVDGVRYSHILDPRTGYPVAGMQSVTVICPDGELADALATSVFVLGVDRGLALVNRLKGVAAILVDGSGEVHYSRGVRDQFAGPIEPAATQNLVQNLRR